MDHHRLNKATRSNFQGNTVEVERFIFYLIWVVNFCITIFQFFLTVLELVQKSSFKFEKGPISTLLQLKQKAQETNQNI
jgi:hypothetical protein